MAVEVWVGMRLPCLAVVVLCAACEPLEASDLDELEVDATSAEEQPLGASLVVGPDADAHVHSAYPNTNFGKNAGLRIDNNGSAGLLVTYLRVAVPPVNGKLSKAVLRLYCANGSPRPFNVSTATGAWSETGLTFANRPPPTTSLFNVPSVKSGTFVDLDVLAAVRPGAATTFVFTTLDADGLTCSSREAASNRPTLNLVVAAPTVSVAQPTAGAVLSGKVVLAALVDGQASATDGRVDFVVDGAVRGPASLGLGWNLELDTRALADGAHTVAARLTTSSAVTTSAQVSFSVKNAAAETWGDHMGVSISGSRANFDKAKALGLRWVRFGWEMGWGSGFDTSLIPYAHSLGLKVLWACQNSRDGHSYADFEVQPYASYCAGAVDLGVDAIEIGNEWNHEAFYKWNGGGPDSTYASQARFHDAVTTAIRARSATIPILNSGWSPESSPNTPTEAMAKLLDHSTAFRQQGTHIANHPYAYSCDSPLRCDYATHPEWNAFLQTKEVYLAAKARGFDRPIWFTELGGPSGKGTFWGGQAYTTATQAQLFKDYLTGVANFRAAGVPVDVIFWHTVQDGQSATNAVETTFGLYDASWNLKPAGQVVKDQASKPW
ncbi:MAG: DNRLRE domain-containing protein [Myxococcaceae bacterium]|nr:DNRLRE domain-containing protein [Myxococcaceae bacterium]